MYRPPLRGHGSVGRAPPCQGGGRGFEPRCPLQFIRSPFSGGLLLIMARWPSGKAGACKALTTGSNPVLASIFADMAQLVEHHLAKVGVAGSSPVVRSSLYCAVLTNGAFSFEATRRCAEACRAILPLVHGSARTEVRLAMRRGNLGHPASARCLWGEWGLRGPIFSSHFSSTLRGSNR